MKNSGIGICCISDYYLSRVINQQGKLGKCSLCGKDGECLEFATLTKMLEDSILKSFSPSSDLRGRVDLVSGRVYKHHGNKTISSSEMLTRILRTDKKYGRKLLSHIKLHLSKDWVEKIKERWLLHAVPNHLLMEEDIFYKVKEAVNSVKSDFRFFNKKSEEFLSEIFKKALDSPANLVKIIKPEDNVYFYRARLAEKKEDVSALLLAPNENLGSPPNNIVDDGRFNSAGTSLFYCSLDAKTCLSEVRPAVGTYVVIGKFKVIKPIRLLMLDQQSRRANKLSPFDPEYNSHVSGLEYLNDLLKHMLIPIPHNKNSASYLISQYVSELLEYKFSSKIHGFLSDSIQYKGEQNICLFRNYTKAASPAKRELEMIYKRTKNTAIGLFPASFETKQLSEDEAREKSINNLKAKNIEDELVRLCDIEIKYVRSVEYETIPHHVKLSDETIAEHDLSDNVSQDDDIQF